MYVRMCACFAWPDSARKDGKGRIHEEDEEEGAYKSETLQDLQ